jgi:hypothetical protein
VITTSWNEGACDFIGVEAIQDLSLNQFGVSLDCVPVENKSPDPNLADHVEDMKVTVGKSLLGIVATLDNYARSVESRRMSHPWGWSVHIFLHFRPLFVKDVELVHVIQAKSHVDRLDD